jgi:hypothetical protein
VTLTRTWVVKLACNRCVLYCRSEVYSSTWTARLLGLLSHLGLPLGRCSVLILDSLLQEDGHWTTQRKLFAVRQTLFENIGMLFGDVMSNSVQKRRLQPGIPLPICHQLSYFVSLLKVCCMFHCIQNSGEALGSFANFPKYEKNHPGQSRFAGCSSCACYLQATIAHGAVGPPGNRLRRGVLAALLSHFDAFRCSPDHRRNSQEITA